MREELKLVDGGARYLARKMAPTFVDAMDELEALLELCPKDAYLWHAEIQKDVRGARCNVFVVFQIKDNELPARREARAWRRS